MLLSFNKFMHVQLELFMAIKPATHAIIYTLKTLEDTFIWHVTSFWLKLWWCQWDPTSGARKSLYISLCIMEKAWSHRHFVKHNHGFPGLLYYAWWLQVVDGDGKKMAAYSLDYEKTCKQLAWLCAGNWQGCRSQKLAFLTRCTRAAVPGDVECTHKKKTHQHTSIHSKSCLSYSRAA